MRLAQSIAGLGLGPIGTMLLIAVFLLMIGSVLDGLALMLLTTPILLPMVTDLGLSPIWFGIFLVRAMEIGFVHPPIGMNLYVIQGIAQDVPLGRIFKGVVPFLAADLVHLVLLVLFPVIALGLPQWLGTLSMTRTACSPTDCCDDPLAGRTDGIGFVGPDLPIDLLAATGRPFGHLPWRGDGRDAVGRPLARIRISAAGRATMLEDWHAGRFDLLVDSRVLARRRCQPATLSTTCASCSTAACWRGLRR